MRLPFLCALLVGLSFVWGNSARAEIENCQFQCEQTLANPQWHSYTPRQRAIATAVAHIITTYYDRTAQPLPVTPETVALVVQSIETEPFETEFVCQRMYEYSSPLVTFDTVDAQLEHIHQQLQIPQSSCLYAAYPKGR
ncbi:MAG: hypothetical protein AAF579_00225 [Cyanobacteria bacterium P01_C01_bin.118]